jgi:hypothetical protein
MMVGPDSESKMREQDERARGTREVKAEDIQAKDSHRRVAQQEILKNQDWGNTWLWTCSIYTKGKCDQ